MTLLKALAALLILVVTNVFVLGGIAWNRSGEPTGMMVFNQCELDSFTRWSGSNDSVCYAFLSIESQKVDKDALKNLYGFDSETKENKKWFERRLYVVLKHGGPEWEEYVENRARRRGYELYGRIESKLIFVDGDVDLARLREKYPEVEDRAFLAGYITRRSAPELVFDNFAPAGGPEDYYWESAVRSIAIESQYREIVKAILDARNDLERSARRTGQQYVRPPCSPTHRITVKWGRRFEPWISSIEAL